MFWRRGAPNVGRPPEPLFAASAKHRVRRALCDRPGYGGSSPVAFAPFRSLCGLVYPFVTTRVGGLRFLRQAEGSLIEQSGTVTNPGLRARVEASSAGLLAASGSGVDPHISPAAARLQVARVAEARGLEPEQVQSLNAAHTPEHTQRGRSASDSRA